LAGSAVDKGCGCAGGTGGSGARGRCPATRAATVTVSAAIIAARSGDIVIGQGAPSSLFRANDRRNPFAYDAREDRVVVITPCRIDAIEAKLPIPGLAHA
jgi:hypothetical protein